MTYTAPCFRPVLSTAGRHWSVCSWCTKESSKYSLTKPRSTHNSWTGQHLSSVYRHLRLVWSSFYDRQVLRVVRQYKTYPVYHFLFHHHIACTECQWLPVYPYWPTGDFNCSLCEEVIAAGSRILCVLLSTYGLLFVQLSGDIVSPNHTKLLKHVRIYL